MRRIVGWAALIALGTGGAAMGAGAERALFIKSKDTKLLEKASFTGKALKTLQPGDEVVWKGADPTEKTLHKVSFKGSQGYVLQANLSPTRPSMEYLTSDGKPISPQAVASSGAATKALTPAAIKYAGEKGVDAKEAAAQIIYVEEHNKRKGTPAAVSALQKANGLGGGK